MRLLAALAAAAAAVLPVEGAEGIRAADLKRHVAFLASDALEGRDTGTPGVASAEDYVAEAFARAGLAPLPGRPDYFVDFALYRASYDPVRTTLEIDLGGEPRPALAGADFRPFPFADDGTVEGEIVFAGYGISAPERGWDDYAGLDVRGKLVLVLRHEPRENDPTSPFDGVRSTEHALYETKAAAAREHGALGMLLATDPLNHGRTDDLRLGGSLALKRGAAERGTAGAEETPFLAVHVGRDVAESLARQSGQGLDALQRQIDAGVLPSRLPALAGARVRLAVHRAADEETVPARDVAGFLPGADPTLRDEWIVVGAHHDHIGGFPGEGDTVFNGADDNASGTSGVLELARAFAAAEKRPRRSLAFVTFTGEEHGMLGSRALVAAGAIPMERVVFMLNLDMIGRNPKRPIDVVGDGFARGLRERVLAANSGERLALEFAGADYFGNSDHDPFYEADVPFLFFFSGTHADYHQVGDHADLLDYRRMQALLRVAARLVRGVADADAAPRFVHHVFWLGATVEVEDGPPPVARVTAVGPDSRAARAGLATGDAIVAVDGVALADPEQVGERLRAIEPGSESELAIARGGERVTVGVFRAKAGYLGLFPGEVDDDARRAHGLAPGQGILVRGVAPDGPSARAGLREGDLLLAIDGKPVGPEALVARLAEIGAGETIAVEIVRDGERIESRLTLGERPERR